ncbi:MAG: PrgI family protein [Ruminococcus sp.]|nr:PrgI family protein [Ruminococcus sp.]
MAGSRNFVTIPKDLNNIKQKFMFNLTKRQCICFGIGLGLGIPMYFVGYKVLGIGMSLSIFLLGIVAAPFIVAGVYCKNGVYFEATVKYMIEYFKKPRKRYYKSVNIFKCIENQIECNKIRKKLKQAEGGKS